MRILVTGAAGYVGSVLWPKLEAAGHTVYPVDIQWFRKDPDCMEADVRHNLGDLSAIECIIHLAAISNDPSVSFYPRLSWETSVLATQQLCQLAVKTGCRFIYASSVSVYGADRGLVTEDLDLSPISDYNKTKMCAERILLSYPEVRPQIIRPATICGLSPRMRLDLTVNMFTMQALTKGVITVHGGEQYRPSIHIDDMCDLYLFMVDHPELTGIWNAGFENDKLGDIAKKIALGLKCKVDTTPIKDYRSYQVNSDKLLNTGFKPKKRWWDAVEEISSHYIKSELEGKPFTWEPQMENLGWMTKLGIKDE